MKLNFCQLSRMNQGLNAVSLFAKLGNEDQVISLLNAGAKREDAVYGYALGGHTSQVNSILEKYPELVIYAAKGYARTNNEAETEKLAPSSNIEIKKHLLEGYAQQGNKTQINAALQSQNTQKFIPVIVKGLAEAGHMLVKQYAINESLQNTAITAAAQSGNAVLVNELLMLQNIVLGKLHTPLKPHATLALGHALIGYSKGRHYEHIEALLELHINPMLCLTAISDKSTIHASDIQSLFQNISDKNLQQTLDKLFKVHFEKDTNILEPVDFSSDTELDILFEKALTKSTLQAIALQK